MASLTGRSLDVTITAAAGCGFLLFGYDQGVMSGLLTGTAFRQQFPEIDTTGEGATGSTSLQGLVVAIYEIGCFAGALMAFGGGEKLGRRWTIIVGSIITIIGAALQAAAYGIPQLIVGRIVAGLGTGLNTATIRMFPILQSQYLLVNFNIYSGLAR
jgi:MFS family permease